MQSLIFGIFYSSRSSAAFLLVFAKLQLRLCVIQSFMECNQLKVDDNFKFQSNKIHFDSIIIDDLGVDERE